MLFVQIHLAANWTEAEPLASSTDIQDIGQAEVDDATTAAAQERNASDLTESDKVSTSIAQNADYHPGLAVEPLEAMVATTRESNVDEATRPLKDGNESVPTSAIDGDDDTVLTRPEEETEAESIPPETADAATPKPSTKRPAKTLVGGLLASSKTMKPFRSPTMNSATSSGQADTPAKQSNLSSSLLASSASGSNASPASTVTPYRNLMRKSAGNKALNKPFISPIVRSAAAASSSTGGTSSENGPSSVMSAFQISSTLPVLERRLANLKNAKRYLKAIDQNLQTSDNTEHILELSAKWLAAGREASEMLWDLTKDQVVEESANGGNSRFGNGFDVQDGPKKESWGWARVPDTVGDLKRRARQELTDMSEDEREEALKQLEDEEEKNPLPDTVEEVISRASSRSSSSSRLGSKRSLSSSSKTSSTDRPAKVAKLDNVPEKDEDEEDTEEMQGTPDEPEVSSQEVDEEVEDDPHKRGMARMLLQCGIQ